MNPPDARAQFDELVRSFALGVPGTAPGRLGLDAAFAWSAFRHVAATPLPEAADEQLLCEYGPSSFPPYALTGQTGDDALVVTLARQTDLGDGSEPCHLTVKLYFRPGAKRGREQGGSALPEAGPSALPWLAQIEDSPLRELLDDADAQLGGWWDHSTG